MVTPSAGHNPGKNQKGQISRAKKHHAGKVKIDYVRNKQERSKTLYKRKGTIIKKVKYSG